MTYAQLSICPVIVGRDRDLARGMEMLHTAAAGRGGLLFISGEAGMGKSRMLRELSAGADALGFRVLVGICQEHDRAFPFAPFLDAVRQFVHSAPAEAVDRLLGAERPILARLLPELGFGGPPAVPLPPEQEKRCLFEAFVGLLTRFARDGGPLLLALEDVHWGDETTLELLQLLPRRLAQVSAAIVLTARSDEPESALGHWLAYLERNRLIDRIDLAPLTAPETFRLIQATIASPVLPPVMTAIHHRTEGNPFLTEELLHALMSQSRGETPSGAWASVVDLDIPSSVTESVARRLAAIDPQTRAVVELAAVIGRRFHFDLLRELSGLDDPALIASLRVLIANQLVIEERDGEALSFAFRHVLTRDAVYGRLLGPERRRLHRRVAQVLNTDPSSSSPVSSGELAYHYAEAEEWAAALRHATAAGDAARAVSANAEAAAQYRRALRAAGHLGPAGAAEAIALGYRCGAVLALLGEFEAARAQFDAALAGARRAGDLHAEQRLLDALAGHYASRDYDAAYRYGMAALDLARAGSDRKDEARALNRLGNIMVNQRQFASGLALHEEALALFESVNDGWGIGDSLDYIGMTHYLIGDLPETRAHITRALTRFEELGDRERIASCLANRAPYYPALDGACPIDGSPEASREDAEEAIRVSRAIDWAAGEAYAHVAFGAALAGGGDYGAALREIAAAEEMAAQIDHQQWGIIARLAHGIMLTHLGALAEAAAIFATARDTAAAMGAVQFLRQAEGCLAICAVARGDEAEADALLAALSPTGDRPRSIAERRALLASAALALRRGHAEAALTATRRLALSPTGGEPERYTPAVLLVQAGALAALGRTADARKALDDARSIALEHGPRAFVWRISAAMATLGRRPGQPDKTELARARTELEMLLGCVGDDRLRTALMETPTARAVLAAPAIPAAPADPLTRRERDVVRLIAQGMGNREIADTLFIAEKTVETHVSNSLGKLGFHSRSQLAVWASHLPSPPSSRVP